MTVIYRTEGWMVVPISPAPRTSGPCKMQRYLFEKDEDGSTTLTLYAEFKVVD